MPPLAATSTYGFSEFVTVLPVLAAVVVAAPAIGAMLAMMTARQEKITAICAHLHFVRLPFN